MVVESSLFPQSSLHCKHTRIATQVIISCGGEPVDRFPYYTHESNVYQKLGGAIAISLRLFIHKQTSLVHIVLIIVSLSIWMGRSSDDLLERS